MNERVFSGVQPTGALHLGNYLGALREFVRLQEQHDCIFCVVDMHAITQPHDPAELRAAVREVASTFIACGLDPKRSILFPQSRVRAHAQLAWILNCTARVGWLNRMTQFKDKAGKDKEGASVGLYAYPVLMAADILLYRATRVPVGADQKQHLELARDIAQKFNHDFGVPGHFPEPRPLIRDVEARVMSLRDGASKMSKSDTSDQSRINLTDDDDAIAQKFRKAKTDSDLLPDSPEGLEDRPEAQNLTGILSALRGEPLVRTVQSLAGKNFSALKEALTEATVEALAPIRARIRELEADPGYVEQVLTDGAERAAAIADPILAETERVVGLSPDG